MGETILQGLSITGLGMGLVFLMIIALWGIMVLLVRLTNRPEKVDEPPRTRKARARRFVPPRQRLPQWRTRWRLKNT